MINLFFLFLLKPRMMKMTIEKELKKAEEFETEIFFRMARQLYSDSITQCDGIFDIALEKTDGFRSISAEVLVSDSRIIKVLRYCTVPVISQMKLGQLVGISSTKDFEDEIVSRGAKQQTLRRIAPVLCKIFSKNLDTQRFLWHQTTLDEEKYLMAIKYAKNWTCSLIANQNSSTAFRNWRKELQESTAIQEIIKAGYTPVETRRRIRSVSDLLPGQCSRECVVVGRNNQKADIAIRLKKSRKLLLIEAKAIGVKIDAFKRIKECREKFDDWKDTFGDMVEVGVVLSGFIPLAEYQSLIDERICVFFEHNISTLFEYVKTK